MIISVTRRLLQGVYRENFYPSICRSTSTNIVKSTDQMQEVWEKKMKFYMKTYEDFFGLTKLTEMHDKVILIQTNLQSVQEKRRKTQEEIFAVQKKLQEMQDILHKTSMGDDMYISVVTQVRELLKEQKQLRDIFSLYDQTEREHQTTLALAINNSQDHEKTCREKNKYLSLVTGIIGGVLGLVGSSINNWRHRKDIKSFASEISDLVTDLKKSVEKLKLVTLSDGTLQNASSNSSAKVEDLLTTIKSHHNSIDDSVKSLQSLLNGGVINENFNHPNDDKNLWESLSEFEKNYTSKLNNYTFINSALIGSYALFLTLFFFYFTKNS